ncbi:MAG: hypothetical protein ACRENP_09560 [Longimicrobiales bacterium]
MREAAEQAGIAPSAFERALAELSAHDAAAIEPTPVPRKPRIASGALKAALLVAVIVAGLLLYMVLREATPAI